MFQSIAGTGKRWAALTAGLAVVLAVWMLVEAALGLAAMATTEPDPRDVCPTGAKVVSYDVSAINVDITLNRYGDHDPLGRMYVLDQDLAAVRAQETAPLPDRVSIGLRDDAIQPLVLRANLGDCVRVSLTNRLPGERASLHIHRTPVDPNNSGDYVGNNADSTVGPGETRTYSVYLEDDPTLEGTYYFHSHGDTRQQVMHGLFGALIAEPAGSVYLHPGTHEPMKSGWEAVIGNMDPGVKAFREQVIAYHEIGDETYRPLDFQGKEIRELDPFTHSYRPCARAVNYRSECFMRRMELTGDGSLAYSSYNNGDPPTPMPRSYVGDPMKTRLINGGSEMTHVHHLHGGSIRWRFQPQAESTDSMYRGFTKASPDPVSDTERLDSQSLAPSESFNLEHECGSGGCQQVAGDFLYHCHIGDHYVGGMWSLWRVYNTLQPGFLPLPDRQDSTPEPVTSVGLLGATLADGTVLTRDNIDAWVSSLLPPQGVPGDYDATVWDWTKVDTAQGPLYLGEPEDTRAWPNYASATPGQRPAILFSRDTGLPAWPLLQPHLGKRPPFAPGAHGPAPYLTTTVEGNSLPTNSDHVLTPADPYRGERALCPAGTPIKRFNVVAITLPIAFNSQDVDPQGMIFALADEKDDILAGRKPAQPMILRVNAGDCVHVTLTSELVDIQENGFFSKVNIHPHFFQFDVQSSDGVITGRSFEQSVRPYATEGRTLARAAGTGDLEVTVTNPAGLRPGIWLGVGLGTNGIELHRIAAINGNTVTLVDPIVRDHARGEAAGVEFVQYAYYPDAVVGTVFIHDHVDGILTWQHGLVGTIIVEPTGSSYRNPVTGEEVRSGPLADIITSNPICAGCPPYSFREMGLLFGDMHHAQVGEVKSWINMRSEPFVNRMDGGLDPTLVLSSVTHGDPSTTLLRAYEDDPVVVRVIDASISSVSHTIRLTGHRFHLEHYPEGDGPEALLQDTVNVGVSERFALLLDGGAGKAGDYLYYSARADRFAGGLWGIFRVHDTRRADLQVLPDRNPPPRGRGFPIQAHTGERPAAPTDAGNPCPTGVRLRVFDVEAIRTKIVRDSYRKIVEDGQVFVLAQDAEAVLRGTKPAEPLVLRVSAGECVEVRLTNRLNEPVSFHAGRVAVDPQRSLGITVGYNYDQSVAPRETRTYRYFIDEAVGAGIVADFAQLTEMAGQKSGLYGAIVSAPEGWNRFLDPVTGKQVSSGWRVVVVPENPSFPAYRDYVLLFHEEDPRIGTAFMPYQPDVVGTTAINYRTEPFEERLKRARSPASVLSSRVHGDPATPLLEAYPGDPVEIHVLGGFGQQTGGFTLSGHRWPFDSAFPLSTMLASQSFGPHQALELHLDGGAGMAGDYLYENHRLPYLEAGHWGIFRVYGRPQSGLAPLPTAPASGDLPGGSVDGSLFFPTSPTPQPGGQAGGAGDLSGNAPAPGTSGSGPSGGTAGDNAALGENTSGGGSGSGGSGTFFGGSAFGGVSFGGNPFADNAFGGDPFGGADPFLPPDDTRSGPGGGNAFGDSDPFLLTGDSGPSGGTADEAAPEPLVDDV